MKTVDQEKWEDENYLIETGVFKTGKTKGVAVRTSKISRQISHSKKKSLYP